MKQNTLKSAKICLLSLPLLLGTTRNGCQTNFSKLSLDLVKQNLVTNVAELEFDEDETICSYESILKKYYNLAVGGKDNPTKSFKEFYEDFYGEGSDRDLYAKTLALAYENDNYDQISSFFGDFVASPASSSSTQNLGGGKDGNDAYYILKNSNEATMTPSTYFCNRPRYNPNVYDYSRLEVGDIIYETENGLVDFGHTALIVENNHKSDFGNYVQTIEAVGGGVQRGYLDDYRIVNFKCYILRVKGKKKELTDKAVYFTEKQVGKSYLWNPLKLHTGIDCETWYCSQLTYSAWKYAGIDIAAENAGETFSKNFCLPSDINNAYNTANVNIDSNYYFSLGFAVYNSEKQQYWLAVHNNTSMTLTLEHSSYLSFPEYITTWDVQDTEKGECAGLKDIQYVKFSPYETKNISFSSDLYATTAGVSYVLYTGVRFITYANHFDTIKMTMDSYHAWID